MEALKGILSLQEAMNPSATVPSLNPALFSLAQMEKMDKPSSDGSPRYQQGILYAGASVVVQTPAVHLQQLFYRSKFANFETVLVPIPPWLRQQLIMINETVRELVTLPPDFNGGDKQARDFYKPLYEGKNLQLPREVVGASRIQPLYLMHVVRGD